ITTTDPPPATATASTDAAIAPLDLVSTAVRLGRTERPLGGFRFRLAREDYRLVPMSQPVSGRAGLAKRNGPVVTPGARGAGAGPAHASGERGHGRQRAMSGQPALAARPAWPAWITGPGRPA